MQGMQAASAPTSYDGSVNAKKLAPGIWVYHNVFTEDMNLIERVEGGLKKPGTRFAWSPANLLFGSHNDAIRNCFDFKIKDDGILGPRDEYSEDFCNLYNEIIDRVKVAMDHYCSQNYLTGISYYECVNIVRYGKGEYFKIHTDDSEAYRCTVSCVGYPNDNYEGGELTFPEFGVKYKPKAGDLVLSPSAYIYAHSAEPVTDDGVKYSLVLMSDRNPFAHRNDSPVYHSQETRDEHGVRRL